MVAVAAGLQGASPKEHAVRCYCTRKEVRLDKDPCCQASERKYQYSEGVRLRDHLSWIGELTNVRSNLQ